MVQKTFTSLKDIEREFGINMAEHEQRRAALEFYLSQGGFVRLAGSRHSMPRLIYPSKAKLLAQISEVKAKLSELEEKRRYWLKMLKDSERYHLINNIKKFSSPLYWRHLAKMLADAEYRADVKRVGLQAHLVCDARWQPMIRMFVNDEEYRRQLVETVEHSIVYKKNRKVGDYAARLLQFRMDKSKQELAEIEQARELLHQELNALKVLLDWAGGR